MRARRPGPSPPPPGPGRARSGRLSRCREASKCLLDCLVAQLKVAQLARLVVVIRGEVQQAVAAQGRQDDFLLAGFLAPQRLLDARGYSVRRLGRRNDAFGAGKPQPGSEALRLRLGDRLDEAE